METILTVGALAVAVLLLYLLGKFVVKGAAVLLKVAFYVAAGGLVIYLGYLLAQKLQLL